MRAPIKLAMANNSPISENLGEEKGDSLQQNQVLDIEKLKSEFIKNEKAAGVFSENKNEKIINSKITIEDKIKEATKRAQRPDCRKAYSNTGLLAIPQLAKDLLTEKGCKW